MASVHSLAAAREKRQNEKLDALFSSEDELQREAALSWLYHRFDYILAGLSQNSAEENLIQVQHFLRQLQSIRTEFDEMEDMLMHLRSVTKDYSERRQPFHY